MFPLQTLQDLVRHMAWADATLWQAVLGCEAAATDARTRNLLLHIHVVQRAFLQVWHGGVPQLPRSDDFTDLASVKAFTEPYYDELSGFMSALDERGLDRAVVMPWVSEFEKQTGRTFDTPTVAETIFQVTSHSTYHRGQVNMRLREIGGTPALIDYIVWIWFGRPASPVVAAG